MTTVSDVEHETPSDRCVECGHEFDRASGIDHDNAPCPGDFTICIQCGSLNVFSETLAMRQPTTDEYLESTKFREIRVLRSAIKTLRAT